MKSLVQRSRPLIKLGVSSSPKRLFDVAFSLSFLMLASPLLGAIALLIKLDDRGPILYRHRRITMNRRPFYCLKFRTMHVDADAQLSDILENDPEAREEWTRIYKLKDDPRVTRAGRILRKTSLDELPQFLNVLRDEMSIVGPRPVTERELVEYYDGFSSFYCSVKPGITGPWQTGKRHDVHSYEERVQQDVAYILSRSTLLDLKIMAKTAVRMINGKGAC